jgi:hypothetical protein
MQVGTRRQTFQNHAIYIYIIPTNAYEESIQNLSLFPEN